MKGPDLTSCLTNLSMFEPPTICKYNISFSPILDPKKLYMCMSGGAIKRSVVDGTNAHFGANKTDSPSPSTVWPGNSYIVSCSCGLRWVVKTSTHLALREPEGCLTERSRTRFFIEDGSNVFKRKKCSCTPRELFMSIYRWWNIGAHYSTLPWAVWLQSFATLAQREIVFSSTHHVATVSHTSTHCLL